jgi:hypothetical protein
MTIDTAYSQTPPEQPMVATTDTQAEGAAPPATDACCGGPSTIPVQAVSPCCGTAVEAQASGGCCGPAAKAEAVATGAGCCG